MSTPPKRKGRDSCASLMHCVRYQVHANVPTTDGRVLLKVSDAGEAKAWT